MTVLLPTRSHSRQSYVLAVDEMYMTKGGREHSRGSSNDDGGSRGCRNRCDGA